MLSQQQNPHAVSYSLEQQQMGSKEINSEGEEDVKTFSIRQYVFACRQISLLQSWPFPEKYLQMCLDRGLRNVLPPFGLCNNSVSESPNNGLSSNLNTTDHDDKNVRVLKSESSPDHNSLEQKKQNVMKHTDSGSFSNINEERSKAVMMSSLQEEQGTMISPSICVKKTSKSDRRRGRRRGRCKKRSMVDILAEAKHCSLEEIYRINQFSYAAAATGNIISEGYCHDQTAAPLENDSERDTDHEVAYNNVDVNVTCLR